MARMSLPAEKDRPAPRSAAYVLDRTRMGALGFEGDLLLGWNAGDSVAADIS